MANILDEIKELESRVITYAENYGIGDVISNNPFIADIANSVEAIAKIGVDVASKNYVDIIPNTENLITNIAKMPADYAIFETTKLPALEQNADQLKADTLKLCDDIKTQYNTMAADIKSSGFQGFVADFNTLVDEVKQDIVSGQGVVKDVTDMLGTLKSSTADLKTQGDVEKAAAGLSGVSGAKDVSGDKSPSAPNTPGQPPVAPSGPSV